MRSRFRRAVCLVFALLMLVGCACAENPGKEREDEALLFRVIPRRIAGLTPASLEALAQKLAKVEWTAEKRDAGSWRLSAVHAGETLWSVSTRYAAGYAERAYFPSQNAYREALGNPLLPQNISLPPDLSALPDAWAEFSPRLFSALQKKGRKKKQKTRVSIKNAGVSPAQEVYTLAAREMNALWPGLAEKMAAALEPVFRLCPEEYAVLRQALPAVRFEGKGEWKRFLTAQGKDMGMQFTGEVKTADGALRQVTLFGGFAGGRGGWLSLSMPDERTRKPWKLQISARITQDSAQTVKLSGSLVRPEKGKQTERTFSAALKTTGSEKKRRVRGTIRLTEKGTDPFTITLTPDFSVTEAGAEGAFGIKKQSGDFVHWQAEVQFAPAQPTAAQGVFPAAADLAGGNDALQSARAAEGQALAQAFSFLTEGLYPGEKAMLSARLGFPRADQTPAAEPQAEDALVLTLGGDACLGIRENWWKQKNTLPVYLEKQGMAWPFSGLRDIFEADDRTLVNLECVFKSTAAGERKSKPCRFRGLPEWTDILKAGSVELVNVANNHHDDYGDAGMQSTRKALEDAGISYSGWGNYSVWETNGRIIGFAGARQRVYRQDPGCIAREIAALRDRGCQVVIFSCHWGEEYAPNHAALQQEMARAAADAGADLIVGTHPHVVQGVGCVGRTPVLWSLGNLTFGGTIKLKTYDAALARVRLLFNGTRYAGCGIDLIPIRTSSRAAEKINDLRPAPAEGEDRERILRLVRQDSPWDVDGTMWFPAF